MTSDRLDKLIIFGLTKSRGFPKLLFVSISILSFTIGANSQTAQTLSPDVLVGAKGEPPRVDCNRVTELYPPDTGPGRDCSSAFGKLIQQNKHFGAETHGTNRLAAYDQSKAPKRASSGDSDWHFAFAPYFYLTGLRGTVGARGRTIDLDASFGKIWDNLDLGLMGAVEVSKKRFVSLTDVQWVKLSNKRDTPGGLFETAKVGVNLFILDPEVGYRLFTSKVGALDVLGGARIWSVETNLNVTSGRLSGFDVSQRKTFAAPVVGVRGLINLSPKFYVSGKFDIGGAGIGADLTTQVFGGVGYRLFRSTALMGGYRYLQVDYDDSKGFLFDTRMNGFVIGAKFTF